MSTPTPRTDAREWTETNRSNAVVLASFARELERELYESRNAERLARVQLAAERAKVRTLRDALQNLCDEQNDAPLETRREEWEETMDEACAALAATKHKP